MTKRAFGGMFLSVALACGSVLLLELIFYHFPRKTVVLSACPVTGSTKQKVFWFGWAHHDKLTVSALEQWLKEREPSFLPQWQDYSINTYSLFGCGFACGRMPIISRITPILDLVVKSLSEQRVAELVQVMRHGSPDEKEKILESISDKLFATLGR